MQTLTSEGTLKTIYLFGTSEGEPEAGAVPNPKVQSILNSNVYAIIVNPCSITVDRLNIAVQKPEVMSVSALRTINLYNEFCHAS